MGKLQGLTVLKKLESLEARTQTLEAKIDSQGLINASSNDQVVELKYEVNALKLSTDSYMNVRSRFFAVFRRDKLLQYSQADYDIIREGITAVHSGDPLVDATMFKKRVRSDDKTFCILYGISWQRVLGYSEDEDTLRVLKVHATALAKGPITGAKNSTLSMEDDHLGRLEASFIDFIDILEREGYPRNFSTRSQTPETLAYWKFWKQFDIYRAQKDVI